MIMMRTKNITGTCVAIFLCAGLLSGFTKQHTRAFNIKDFGAVGDGKTDDAVAIQKTIDACWAAGGGQVIVPGPAVFLTGPFDLKPGMELYVETGAVLLANPDESIYHKSAFRENTGEGMVWIGGQNLVHVTLCGRGTIDGNGIAFMGAELDDSYVLKPFSGSDPRPHVLTIVGGKDIRIRDLTIRNSAYWTIHLVGCDDVVVSGITLLNSLKVRNSDGIDIDHSKNVRISDCYIESGDDCICLKNRREYAEFGACEDITVSNCTMTSRSCAVKIGSENMDTIRRVVFNNCVIKKSNRGIGIQHRDEGMVSDVLFSNMVVDSHLFSDVWWGKAEPVYVTAFRRAKGNNKDAGWRFPKGQTEGRVGQIRNIHFSNLQCSSENGIYVSGESADKISGIFFDQVSVHLDKTTPLEGGVFDRRPCEGVGMIKGHSAAFFFDTAAAIAVTNCMVSWGSHLPAYFTYALESRGVPGLTVSGLNGKAAFPAKLPATKITR